MMRLHNHPFSGNCYKIRLFLALLDIPCEIVPVDVAAGGHKTPAFLRLNPRGQIPVLEDEGTVLFDSQAILAYIAARYAPDWAGRDAAEIGQISQWLSFAAKELSNGLQAARLYHMLGTPIDIAAANAVARASVDILDLWLADRSWLVADRPTIADIACYPYVALAHEAQIETAGLSALRAWLMRIEALPGFVDMAGEPA
ncbi:glutathione S-transferase family protein [Rhizobium sp. RU36D]|uniref:glutathione S-transferase family protein n=1 Tax=Rhizobium sp. RU36D TaxID=1907415 RepID=UPI0009D7F538|nr:glutathione S-transferase family protein [Rhizobium sp. RU36D]SMD12825.1 glutathione S-transferase [Rhizobium sp. RU36D]